jgi:hypothetical protein
LITPETNAYWTAAVDLPRNLLTTVAAATARQWSADI